MFYMIAPNFEWSWWASVVASVMCGFPHVGPVPQNMLAQQGVQGDASASSSLKARFILPNIRMSLHHPDKLFQEIQVLLKSQTRPPTSRP